MLVFDHEHFVHSLSSLQSVNPPDVLKFLYRRHLRQPAASGQRSVTEHNAVSHSIVASNPATVTTRSTAHQHSTEEPVRQV